MGSWREETTEEKMISVLGRVIVALYSQIEVSLTGIILREKGCLTATLEGRNSVAMSVEWIFRPGLSFAVAKSYLKCRNNETLKDNRKVKM